MGGKVEYPSMYSRKTTESLEKNSGNEKKTTIQKED